jgi:chromosome segregation ATPase
MSELSERKEAARLVRCTCPRNFKFHAENCPIQPGEHQEDWARNADAENQALREDKDELYAEREEDARRIEALQARVETLASQRGALVRRLRFFVQEYEALQARAERAEALLRDAVDLVDSQTTSEQGWHDDVIDYFSDHRPTQETDSEHLHRFGEHGTCECGAVPGD